MSVEVYTSHWSVHPHACGEHASLYRQENGLVGSSPRMWGTPDMVAACRHDIRFIPTHVGNTLPRGVGVPVKTVHPHACGEHCPEHSKKGGCAGSSPRMWGTRWRDSTISCTPRFIPTHVGNTLRIRPSPEPRPVHPHACGEHAVAVIVDHSLVGSSPRMWGTHLRDEQEEFTLRFIPTHVGNTSGAKLATAGLTVHPHACGEHCQPPESRFLIGGSSPRMWGTPVNNFFLPFTYRFIPTHVGNTCLYTTESLAIPVHPHACGEHLSHSLDRYKVRGSSPRMWGTQPVSISIVQASRFIPTHVGNTSVRRGDKAAEPVHPHACGEHWTSGIWNGGMLGSSPRMWGTLERGTFTRNARRFIPTHVGNTDAHHVKRARPSVHPHACGEHCTVEIDTGYLRGSSPRMWGTRLLVFERTAPDRFIPTHVGNT